MRGEAELRIYNLKKISPPQTWSQVVVCVSTPRKYPRSGYFLVIHKIVQNQLRKPSVNGVPTIFTFPIVKMAEKRHQIENRTTFSKENPFFDCSCYGTLLADGFFN